MTRPGRTANHPSVILEVESSMASDEPAAALQAASARLQIRDAVDKNCVMYDEGRWAEAYSMFTEDATLVLPDPQPLVRGRDALVARFDHREPGSIGPYGYVRHCITTHFVAELTDSRAEAFSYYFVFVGGPIGAAGRYHDHFVNVDGRWLIERREVLQDLSLFPPSHP
jgi:hypothetical protein